MHQCQFCNRMLSSKSNLTNHQKTAKYCLKIQQKEAVREYKCPGCDKVFQQKTNRERHTQTCGGVGVLVESQRCEQLQKKNEWLSEKVIVLEKRLIEEQRARINEVKELTDRIERLATRAIDRPTTQNNKQVINLAPFDLTPEKAKAIFDREYNESYFLDGPKGLARFVNNHILKTEKGETIYACFDASRCVFKYKNEDGSYIKDIKAKKLVEIIYPSALAHGDLLAAKFTDEYFDMVRTEDDHDTVKTAEIRSNLATDSFLTTRRLKDEPEPFANELATLASR
jgi:hypothetical protein